MTCSICHNKTSNDFYCKECRKDYNKTYQHRLSQTDSYSLKRKIKYYERKYGLKNGMDVTMKSDGQIAKYELGKFYRNGKEIKNKKGFIINN